MAVERALDPNNSGQPHDRWMAALARRQHGVVGRFQLLVMGMAGHAIDYRVKVGRLHVVHRGVYAVGHARLTSGGVFMAAVLAGGADAVLSHLSAAAHWNLREDNRPTIDVTCPRALHTRAGITWHRGALRPDETTNHDGIPITTVPRTLFDLAAEKGARALERGMHEAEVQRLTDPLSLQDLVTRYPLARGVRAVRAVLGSRAARDVTVNDFEEAFRTFLIATGLPLPAFNQPLLIAGRWLRPDCTWHAQRLIAELDGRASHDTDAAYESDRQRDRDLLIAGWRSTRITWRQLNGDPERLERELRALLGG